MAATCSTPPTSTADICHEWLRDVIGCDNIVQEHCLRVYTLGLSHCANQSCHTPLETQVGWKFVISEPSGATVIADLTVASPDARPEVVGIARNDICGYVQKCIQGVAGMPEASQGHYELRWLSIPGLLLECLWWMALNDSPDLVMPVRGLDEAFEMRRLYSMPEFLELVRPSALEWLAGKDE